MATKVVEVKKVDENDPRMVTFAKESYERSIENQKKNRKALKKIYLKLF